RGRHGKPHREQGQTGNARGCQPEFPGGPLEVTGNGDPRWMAADHRTRLTGRLVRPSLSAGYFAASMSADLACSAVFFIAAFSRSLRPFFFFFFFGGGSFLAEGSFFSRVPPPVGPGGKAPVAVRGRWRRAAFSSSARRAGAAAPAIPAWLRSSAGARGGGLRGGGIRLRGAGPAGGHRRDGPGGGARSPAQGGRRLLGPAGERRRSHDTGLVAQLGRDDRGVQVQPRQELAVVLGAPAP